MAVAAATLKVGRVLSKTILHADGEHDDSLALNAWFRGEPVYHPDGRLVGDVLSHQLFLVSDKFEGIWFRGRAEGVFCRNSLATDPAYLDVARRALAS